MNNLHIYIDESGDLETIETEGASKYFLIGCVITHEDEALRGQLFEIESLTKKSLFLSRHRDQLSSDGFHATSNHFDLYNHMVSHLYTLPFRSHFILIDKSSLRHQAILAKFSSKKEVYDFYMNSLLRDRLLKYKNVKIHFVLEQNLSNPTPLRLLKRQADVTEKIDKLIDDLIKKAWLKEKVNFSVSLGDKEDFWLHLVDYMCCIVHRNYFGKGGKTVTGLEVENFETVSHKIGSIYLYSENKYFQPRKDIC